MNEEDQKKLQEQIQALETLAKQWMTADAITRYGTLKAAYPEKAIQIIALIAQLVQQGSLKEKISDAELKSLLTKMQPERKETTIRRM